MNHMYEKLRPHVGHDISCVTYMENSDNDPVDICIECNDCGCVLISAEDYEESCEERDITNRIEFEELYVGNLLENTTTAYFIVEKSLLDELLPGKYPDAEHGTISIEYPTNCPEVNMASVMISPTAEGLDYDWTDLDLPYEDVEKLMDMTREKINKKPSSEFLNLL